MKAAIKRLESLNQLAIQLKEKTTIERELANDWSTKYDTYYGSVGNVHIPYSLLSDEQKELFGKYVDARTKHEKAQKELEQMERKFKIGVKALAKSLGMEAHTRWGFDLTSSWNEVLDHIYYRIKRSVEALQELRLWDDEYLSVKETITINYQEITM